MKVVGITTQQEVYIGSKDRNFRINEFLIIEDSFQGDLLGEVVEAKTYNPYIPLSLQGELVDASVLNSLKAIGYNIEEDTIYISKIRLTNEALYPVETGSNARIPKFSEVKGFMIRAKVQEGLSLGVIKNTDQMTKDMDDEYKDILYTFEDGGIKKQRDIPYIYDIKSMHHYPHIGVFGGSGSGKSFGLRVIMEELMELNIPGLVLDPHFEMDFSEKQEFSNKEYKDSFKCLQVGLHVGVRFQDINSQDLKNLLGAAGNLTDSMRNVVDILFKRNDSFSSFSDRLKMLAEAQEEGSIERIERRINEAESQIDKDGWKIRKDLYNNYDKTCPYSSVRGIIWRLYRLYNEGIFSKDSREIEEGLQMGKLIVIQGSTRILQVFSTYLINNLYQKRRAYKDSIFKKTLEDYFPPFIIITDEAHNFAPKAYESPSKAILKEISQEGRKYGVFLILASQRPTLLDETITAQLNTKLIFRTVRASDIQTIKEETDISFEEANRLPYLKTGDVFISEAAMGRIIFARIRAAYTNSPHSENPFDELRERRQDDIDEFFNIIKDKLPINGNEFLDIAKDLEVKFSTIYPVKTLEAKLDFLVDQGKLGKEKSIFYNIYHLAK